MLVTNQVATAEHTSNSLQTITINLTPKVRKAKLEGRDYLVVPMVMITEGVHNGSNGPLYYPKDELEKTPAVWDHKPIVIYHPTTQGQAISACTPEVINTRKVGMILGTKFEKGKLKSEAWLEASRLREVDIRVLQSIEASKPMEVSTGLFTDNDEEAGEWNGEKYTATARNYRPDHLAILPDQKGACSLADGAGLMLNVAGVPEELLPRVLQRAVELVKNELSLQDISSILAKLLRERIKNTDKNAPVAFPWPVDIYSAYFIYEDGGKYFRQAYSESGDTIALTGLPQEVVRTTTYKTVDGKAVTNRRNKAMDKKKFVDDLIANTASRWEEDDREYLEAMDESKLEKLAPVQNQAKCPSDLSAGEQKKWDGMDEEERMTWLKSRKAPEKKPPFIKNDDAGTTDPAPVEEEETVESYIAKAPEPIREMLEAGLSTHNAQKKSVIGQITANKANRFTPEQLMAKSLNELQAIAALAGTAKKPVANFGAMGDGVQTVQQAEEPLSLPVFNFDRK